MWGLLAVRVYRSYEGLQASSSARQASADKRPKHKSGSYTGKAAWELRNFPEKQEERKDEQIISETENGHRKAWFQPMSAAMTSWKGLSYVSQEAWVLLGWVSERS